MFEVDPSLAPDEQVEAAVVNAFESKLEAEGQPPRIVYLLLAMNVLVFLVMVMQGVGFLAPSPESLFRWGGNFPPATLHGEWWRLLSAMFIHAGVMHLAFNMYVLWAGGIRMERILGHLGFSTTYLLSGLLGGVTTMVFHPDAVGVGASGAIFGIYGALLGFLVRDRNAIPRPVFIAMGKSTLVFLGYNLLFSLRPGVDLAAHFGGLLGGVVCGFLLSGSLGTRTRPRQVRLHLLTFVGGLLTVGLLAGAVATRQRDRSTDQVDLAELEGVQEVVRKALQEHFNARQDVTGIEVRKITVLQKDGARYSGTALLWWIDREVTLSLSFEVEGTHVTWNLGSAPSPHS